MGVRVSIDKTKFAPNGLLRESMITQSTDAYMYHQASMG